MALKSVKDVQLWGVRYETSIEVNENRLRELDMTLDEVANAIRASSMDLPAGQIKGNAGNILLELRVKPTRVNTEYRPSKPNDGTELKLSEVATVRDGFTDNVSIQRFDRKTSFTLGVFSLKGQNILDISEEIHDMLIGK